MVYSCYSDLEETTIRKESLLLYQLQTVMARLRRVSTMFLPYGQKGIRRLVW